MMARGNSSAPFPSATPSNPNNADSDWDGIPDANDNNNDLETIEVSFFLADLYLDDDAWNLTIRYFDPLQNTWSNKEILLTNASDVTQVHSVTKLVPTGARIKLQLERVETAQSGQTDDYDIAVSSHPVGKIIAEPGNSPLRQSLLRQVRSTTPTFPDPSELEWLYHVPRVQLQSAVASSDTKLKLSNPQLFLFGRTEYPDIIANYNVPALVVFYNSVRETSFTVHDFDVNLMAIPAQILNPEWTKISGPAYGHLLNPSQAQAVYRNPRKGGVYVFDFTGDNATTRTHLVLPLAGAEVKEVIRADIARADIFAAAVRAKYSLLARHKLENQMRWFWKDGAGDYLGRPDNADSPTFRKFNQVNDDTGMGAVCTWQGIPVRLAKISNYLAGYTMEKMGVVDPLQQFSRVFGTSDDKSAEISFNGGVSLAEGTHDYDFSSYLTALQIWNSSDDKVKRLWPNTMPCDNHFPAVFNFNNAFQSPGFLNNSDNP
jgi:hypothetical protein